MVVCGFVVVVLWFVATALSIGNFYSYTSATRQPALSFCPDQLMPVDQLLLFLTLTLFVSASPGPVMLAAMANGGSFIMGWLRSPRHQRVFNCLCGGALALAGVLMLWLKQ